MQFNNKFTNVNSVRYVLVRWKLSMHIKKTIVLNTGNRRKWPRIMKVVNRYSMITIGKCVHREELQAKHRCSIILMRMRRLIDLPPFFSRWLSSSNSPIPIFFFSTDVNLLQHHRRQSLNLLHYLPMILRHHLLFHLIVHRLSCVVFANIVAIHFVECVCISNFISPITNHVLMMRLSLHRQWTILYRQHHHHHSHQQQQRRRHHHHHHLRLNYYSNALSVWPCSIMKIH